MKNGADKLEPVFSHAEPVLAVRDISETVLYWHETLGFPNKWIWDPPNHGGVSWHGAFIQFSQNPALATASKGNSVWINVRRLDTLYALHQEKNAEIVAPLENQPWGMAQYTIREINGYFVHFAGHIAEREKSETTLPPTIRITGRVPTAQEYLKLGSASDGSSSMNEAMAELRLAAAVFGVVAEDILSGEVVGYVLLLGDHASFYYVKDLAVHPAWQAKRVGTALMQELNRWLETNAANNALVTLITRETLEPFFQQFGFAEAFAMLRYIERNEKNR